jgi:hypothetical protein
MSRATNLTGRTSFRLTALRPTKERRGNSVVWRCRCLCGRRHKASAAQPLSGFVQSCGYPRRETAPLNADRADPTRDAAMRRDRAEGMTFDELAAKHGVSRQRAHQIAGRPGT